MPTRRSRLQLIRVYFDHRHSGISGVVMLFVRCSSGKPQQKPPCSKMTRIRKAACSAPLLNPRIYHAELRTKNQYFASTASA
jgi:hypothetical protein